MVRNEPHLALGLLIYEKWGSALNGVATSLPSAVDTAMWGYNLTTPKEVMIVVGEISDEPEEQLPQIAISSVAGLGTPVQNGEDVIQYVRAISLVPREYDNKNPAVLKNWCYQLMMEVRRICLNSITGTKLSDDSNADYWISDAVRDSPLRLWPYWHAHEITVPLHYTS